MVKDRSEKYPVLSESQLKHRREHEEAVGLDAELEHLLYGEDDDEEEDER